MSRIAIVQRPPTFLNRAETTSTAVISVREAAAAGAQLVVFPEAFIPGYQHGFGDFVPAGTWHFPNDCTPCYLLIPSALPGTTWRLCVKQQGRTR